jgi:hypothetical protein
VQDAVESGVREMNRLGDDLADAPFESTAVELSEIEVPGFRDLRKLVHVPELVVDDKRKSRSG